MLWLTAEEREMMYHLLGSLVRFAAAAAAATTATAQSLLRP